jgi:hypothetical protein
VLYEWDRGSIRVHACREADVRCMPGAYMI